MIFKNTKNQIFFHEKTKEIRNDDNLAINEYEINVKNTELRE
jgi:hypothetical protein